MRTIASLQIVSDEDGGFLRVLDQGCEIIRVVATANAIHLLPPAVAAYLDRQITDALTQQEPYR